MERIEKIRKRLKSIRIEKGFTQDYIGEQLNISQISYHKLENGKTTLKLITFIKLAQILEVTECNLLGCFE